MMTDQELEKLISCRPDGEPEEAVFWDWAQQSGLTLERVRDIYRSVCDQRRSHDATAHRSEGDPTGDF